MIAHISAATFNVSHISFDKTELKELKRSLLIQFWLHVFARYLHVFLLVLAFPFIQQHGGNYDRLYVTWLKAVSVFRKNKTVSWLRQWPTPSLIHVTSKYWK